MLSQGPHLSNYGTNVAVLLVTDSISDSRLYRFDFILVLLHYMVIVFFFFSFFLFVWIYSKINLNYKFVCSSIYIHIDVSLYLFILCLCCDRVSICVLIWQFLCFYVNLKHIYFTLLSE